MGKQQAGPIFHSKPFSYTDANDLSIVGEKPKPWYKRLRKPRNPVAWVTAEEESVPTTATAYTMPISGEVRVSPIEVRRVSPLYGGDDALLAAAEMAQDNDQASG